METKERVRRRVTRDFVAVGREAVLRKYATDAERAAAGKTDPEARREEGREQEDEDRGGAAAGPKGGAFALSELLARLSADIAEALRNLPGGS